MKVKRICERCGKEFYVVPSQVKVGRGKYCSKECASTGQRKGELVVCQYCGKKFYAARAKLKRGNAKYCSRKCIKKKWQTVKCQQCGKEFKIPPAVIKQGGGKFCSYDCHAASERKGKFKRCSFCGKVFYVPINVLKNGGGKFCCKVCYATWQIENTKGKNSPTWRGGVSYLPYCSKFNEAFKQRIRNKFDNKCFICGKTKEENGKNLCVHHCNYSKDCLCDDDITCQFVPLCASCHTKTNNNRDYWQEYLMAKLRSRLDGYYI